MNLPLYVVLVVVMVAMVVLHCFNLYNHIQPPTDPEDDLEVFDNSRVPIISPPEVIVIEENELVCHEILTPCKSDGECQLCREALAKCYTFEESVLLELPNGETRVMEPGESFCLALDAKRARSCNPHTGTWVMRQVNTTNYAIICHCDFPGLVIQATIYDDCDIDVGCRPYGNIANLYATPLECECQAGYHPDRNEHAPFCRPSVVRDMQANPTFFHRPPCRDGYIISNHPALNFGIRTLFPFNVCIPDPCSIDPVTGEHHEGRLEYYPNSAPGGRPIVMCFCELIHNLYPVYSPHSIMDQCYGNDTIMANACIKPLRVPREEVRSDIKVFWGSNSVKSNADVVFQVNPSHVHPRYYPLMVPRKTDHPRERVTTDNVLKFQIMSCFFKESMDRWTKDIYQFWWDYNFLRRHNSNNCPLPGDGQCHRHCQTGNVSTSCNRCVPDFVTNSYRHSCFFVRHVRNVDRLGEIGQICLGNSASFYNPGNAPVVFYLSGRFATQVGYGQSSDNQTIHLANSWDSMPESQYQNAAILLDTYPWYTNH